MDYEARVAKLPKPQTAEEQYMYNMICNIAGVANKYGYKNNPFWRMEQYWKAFAEVAEARVTEPIVPGFMTVGTDALKEDAVVADKIKNGTITLVKLATEITDLLLGDGKVTETMLNEDVASKLLGEGNVQTENLADGAVTAAKLALEFDEEPTEDSNNLVTSGGIKRYVDEKLNFTDVNEVGF